MALHKSALVLLLSFHPALSQYYPFCLDGVSAPNFSSTSQVDVIFAQAPLFSTNPKFGDKLGLLNLFHTSLLFAQGEGDSRRYWTLEFDFIGGNLVSGLVPNITNGTLHWRNDARYCLTNGLLWGRKHWSKRFDVLMSVPAAAATSAFHDFMATVNSTSSGKGPQYQLWRVAHTNWRGSIESTFVKDTTCADGAVWFVHHLSSVAGAVIPKPINIKATAVVIEATQVAAINTNDTDEWLYIVNFYKQLADLASGNKSIGHKLLELAEVAFERKYVYDSNVGVYYAIHGNHIPWMRFEYTNFPLTSPWSTSKLQPQSGSFIV